MSTEEEVVNILSKGGHCKICDSSIEISNDLNNNNAIIKAHIFSENHITLKLKQLQFSSRRMTFVDEKVATVKFGWEENFDLKLLENDNIIIDLNKRSIYCKSCECSLPPLSLLKEANVYNIKVHILGSRHNKNSSGGLSLKHINNFKPLKRNQVIEKKSKQLKQEKTQEFFQNVDLVFCIFEEKIRCIAEFIKIGFNKFHVNRNLIVYKSKNEYYCNLCEIHLSVGYNSKCYYNMAKHLSGNKHLKKLKTSFSCDAEYNVLLQLQNKSKFKKLKKQTINDTVSDSQAIVIPKIKQNQSNMPTLSNIEELVHKVCLNVNPNSEKIDQIFSTIEQKILNFENFKNTGFTVFQYNRSIILLKNTHDVHCKLCEVDFPVHTNTCYNMLIHLSGKIHLKNFKNSFPRDTEYNILLKLAKSESLIKTLINTVNHTSMITVDGLNNAVTSNRDSDLTVAVNLLSFADNMLFKTDDNVNKDFCLLEDKIKCHLPDINCTKFQLNRELISNTDKQLYRCKLCEVYVPDNVNNLAEHLGGSKHINKLKQKYKDNNEYAILMYLRNFRKKIKC